MLLGDRRSSRRCSGRNASLRVSVWGVLRTLPRPGPTHSFHWTSSRLRTFSHLPIRCSLLLISLLVELLPEPEVLGLLALMMIQESRRAARSSPDGELVLLEHQDRSLWDQRLIAEGSALVERSLATRQYGAYTLQAAIAAVHAQAASPAATDQYQGGEL